MKKTILFIIFAALSIGAMAQSRLRGGASIGDHKVSGTNIEVVDSLTKTDDGEYAIYMDGDTIPPYTPVSFQVDGGTLYPELADTALYFAPVIGVGNAGDTAAFALNNVIWGARWDGSHSLVITKVTGTVAGTSPDIDLALLYDTNYKDGTPTTVFSSDLTVTTTDITTYTVRYATGGGNVTSDGGGTITSRGVCWSTSANPTTADSKFTSGGTTGTFSGRLYPLKANTTYHYRAFATNSSGTSYGADQTFTTPVQSVNTTGGKYLYHNGKLIISR